MNEGRGKSPKAGPVISIAVARFGIFTIPQSRDLFETQISGIIADWESNSSARIGVICVSIGGSVIVDDAFDTELEIQFVKVDQ